jgi:hypothetical protein
MAAKNKKRGDKLLVLWNNYKSVAAECLAESVDKKFTALSGAVCAMVSADAMRFSRLSDSDEGIFEHLVGLMGVYGRVIELVGEYKFENSTVNALVQGICEVLAARLAGFEDAKEPENPITIEKKEIINEALSKVSAAFGDFKSNFSTGLRESEDEEWDESYDMILRSEFFNMYTCYTVNLKACLSKLDDLYGRKTARFYTELIEREWEELGNIIKVQVLALEQAAKKDEQQAAIAGILDALREAYQQIGPVIESLQSLSNTKKSASSRNFDDFDKGLETALEAVSPNPKERKLFFAALDSETLSLIDDMSLESKKAAYALQRMVSAEVLLADEVASVFQKAAKNIPEADKFDDIERDILAGISETIDIKIAGLKESVANFNRQSTDILKDFSAEKDDVNEEERKSVLAAARRAWASNPPNETDVRDFFARFQKSDAFAPCREGVEKKVLLYTEILEKSSFRFKKEVLLYEICTFEEILTHSVSRLHNSQNPRVLAAAQMLDDTFRSLEIILKKNNIAVIRPEIRELFNAKEHEVLVAEKQDGFEKGEIIKIVTAGYRVKDQVILRANVIAAR